MKINQIINEVRVLKPGDEQPLKDSETIRVYHGTGEPSVVIATVTKGLSGAVKVPRRYSYENNNNPRGLFVTPHLKTAKEFGNFILEFHTKVSDLEAPVWPGGTYTVPGEMSQMFHNDGDRDKARQQQRKEMESHALELVRNSDSPDVAFWLLAAGESQALFTGNLNRNSVRAIWIRSEDSTIAPYKRFSVPQVIKMYKDGQFKDKFGTTFDASEFKKSDIGRDTTSKMFEPRETATLDKLVDRLVQKYSFIKKTPEQILSTISKNPKSIKRLVWTDTQYDNIVKDLDQ